MRIDLEMGEGRQVLENILGYVGPLLEKSLEDFKEACLVGSLLAKHHTRYLGEETRSKVKLELIKSHINKLSDFHTRQQHNMTRDANELRSYLNSLREKP